MSTLDHYLQAFTHLKCNHSRGPAPHKPVLLLTVLSLAEDNLLPTPLVLLNDELRFRFQLFFDQLNRYDYQATLYNPFFYMTSEGFWDLQARPGEEERILSKKPFRSPLPFEKSVLGARLDKELFALLQHTESREQLKSALFQKYFPKQELPIPKTYQQPDLDRLATLLAEPPQAVLSTDPAYIKKYKLENPSYRRAAFSVAVRTLYDHRCAISGQRIRKASGSLIDACHIQPWAKFKDDSLQNGLALTPTLHRAFDMGLIGIDRKDTVRVSPVFSESTNPYNLQQFQGQALQIPRHSRYRPDPQRLHWHLEHVFLNP